MRPRNRKRATANLRLLQLQDRLRTLYNPARDSYRQSRPGDDSHRLSAVFVRYGPVRFKVKRFRLDFFCRILSSDPTTNWPVKNLLPMPANESQVWLGFQNIRLRNGKRVEASQVLHMADPRKFRHPNSSSATIASRSMTCPSPRKV
jgi:hypothetical protein